nr:hypothetical protein [Tanacetum cinerariifolium]
MIAILEKSEHNVDFHQIVDFVEASHIRYALTINPTVYVSHIRRFWSTSRIETTNEGTKILATVDGFNEFSSNIATVVGDGSRTPTEPHHTPSPKIQQSPHHDLSSSLHPTETIPTETPTGIPTLRKYSRRATRIAQSKALPTAADEPASLLGDDSQGEAFPTDLEISSLKARIKLFEDKDKGTAELSGDDAPIKGRSLETGEESGVERSTERGSNDTKELVNLLTSMDASNILTSGVQVVSVPPVAEVSTVDVPTGSGLVPTVSAIFTTASVVTPYSRCPREISAKDKGKKKMVESDTPKKKKLQEQIDVQIAREMEEQMAREDQRMDEQIARDAEIARIHTEEEL